MTQTPDGAVSQNPDGEAEAARLGDRDAEPSRVTRTVARSTLRRAPRFGRFTSAGVLVGAVLAALAAILGPPGTILGRGTIFLLVFLALGTAGAVIGSLLAVLADRRSVQGRPHRP